MVNTITPLSSRKARCRQIVRSDFDGIVDLLTHGFPVRTASYWRQALSRLENHIAPPGYPKYGYLLESEGAPVGVILLIHVTVEVDGKLGVRCYLSSWYVDPAFRSYAPLLITVATKCKHVTYVNVSPDPHTWPIIEAQGFLCYSSGQFHAVPLLSLQSEKARVHEIRAERELQAQRVALAPDLLSSHAELGCLSLLCETPDGKYPFVLQTRRIGRGFIPSAQLVYCENVADIVRFARPLGVFLLKRGIFWISIDSNGPVHGLAGLYFEGKAPKYFKGPARPRHGDLAYTEAVLIER